ncbi:MAG: right-handed parallel beta-helix repeat-containing protein [Kiritimatiellae bacterium]|nr:right-handed parallel beta-helix repeat-containing protein [Kiritimatiellia bacterium]
MHTAGNKWSFSYGATTVSGGTAEVGARHVVRTGPSGLYVDGKLIATPTAASFVSPGFLRLFSNHTYDEGTDAYSASGWGRADARIYSLKFYEPDEHGELQLVHDIRGCRLNSGVIGIYDDVTGSAYANTSTSYPIGGQFRVLSENGTGNVVSLTNTIKCVSALSTRTKDLRIVLDPGVYSLADTAMASGSHLYLNCPSGTILSGGGADRAETILLGGGSASSCRVAYFYNGGQTITNLTITGGYMPSSDGGGVTARAAGYGTVVDCIVSNNYAKGSNGNGGGGLWGVGTVRGCLIANNTAAGVGGGCRSCTTVEDCDVLNNLANGSYGGGVSGGTVRNCRIVGNTCKYHGGGLHSTTTISCLVKDNVCHKGGNYGTGGGLYSGTATNCTFVGNGENNSDAGYGSAAAGSTLIDCTTTNSVGWRSIFEKCKLRRCYVADCGAKRSDGTYNFCVFGRSDGSVIYTNVNCVVENISLSNAADRVAVYCQLVNCTVRNVKCKTNGPLAKSCTAVNTVIAGCTPYDLVAGTSSTQLVNCVYQTASGTFAEGQLVNCRQAGRLRWDAANAVPGSIRANSPAYNAALQDDWVLSLVGDVDVAGQPRVKFGALDIGAVECQSDFVPGMVLMFW